jgi:putative glutamine amidotransferase
VIAEGSGVVARRNGSGQSMIRPRIGITCARRVTEDGLLDSVSHAYVDAVLAAGGLPVLLPVLDPTIAPVILEGLEGLLLTGGGDVDPVLYGAVAVPEVYGVDPDRDAWELALIRQAELPMLGICRGAQVMNVARGGTLVLDLPGRSSIDHRVLERQHEEVHVVGVKDGSCLRRVLGLANVKANTLHHQSVDVVGDGLVVVGCADDDTIEAIEDPGGPFLGVQWHPELLVDSSPHRRLFSWLVDTAAG